MFYRTEQPHDLKHNPFNAIVVPRPIGWISSINCDGQVNLAPYSFFNAVAYTPPQVMFSATNNHSAGGLKDSVQNIQDTGEFVVNLATWPLRKAMNLSSTDAPHGVNEFELAGLTQQPAQLVKAPWVQESPIHLECRHTQTVTLLTANPDQPNTVIFGQVIGIHIDDSVIVDGMLDYSKTQPIGRLGYKDYVRVEQVFAMDRPR